MIVIKEYAFETIVCKMPAILPPMTEANSTCIWLCIFLFCIIATNVDWE